MDGLHLTWLSLEPLKHSLHMALLISVGIVARLGGLEGEVGRAGAGAGDSIVVLLTKMAQSET